ncbi:hypothetical protein [Paraburkholderia megapolitana]|uniref:hypothetical protein n=1 Tax=Paraburkholderia megapolitana TaxID=420953 RepID=UPI0038B9CD45
MKRLITAASAAAIVLTGCGGGGGGDGKGNNNTPAATPTAAGEYTGFTSDNRAVDTTVLDTGAVYVQYGGVGQPNAFAGFMVGTVQSSGGALSGGSGFDYNLEGQGTNAVTMTGTYAAKQTLDAAVAYSNGTKITTHQSYETNFDQTPSLQALAGNYSGYASGAASQAPATFAIDAAGRVTGSEANGCAFTGTVTPHARGNIFDMSVQFGATACTYAGQTATGIVMIWNPGVLHAMLQTPSKVGVLFLAKQQ